MGDDIVQRFTLLDRRVPGLQRNRLARTKKVEPADIKGDDRGGTLRSACIADVIGRAAELPHLQPEADVEGVTPGFVQIEKHCLVEVGAVLILDRGVNAGKDTEITQLTANVVDLHNRQGFARLDGEALLDKVGMRAIEARDDDIAHELTGTFPYLINDPYGLRLAAWRGCVNERSVWKAVRVVIVEDKVSIGGDIHVGIRLTDCRRKVFLERRKVEPISTLDFEAFHEPLPAGIDTETSRDIVLLAFVSGLYRRSNPGIAKAVGSVQVCDGFFVLLAKALAVTPIAQQQ